MTRITACADLHGHTPELPGGDLLIVAGDLTARDTKEETLDFMYWLSEQEYKEKVVIAGNHDTFICKNENWFLNELECISKSIYLCDSGTEFEGLKIWGSPWSLWFKGINPKCEAFTGCESDLAKKFALMPNDVDIVVTHSPPYGILDQVKKYNPHNYWDPNKDGYEEVGSKSLREHVMQRIKPKLHIFGHIHEWGGQILDTNVTRFVNCSHVNEVYDPVNAPITLAI